MIRVTRALRRRFQTVFRDPINIFIRWRGIYWYYNAPCCLHRLINHPTRTFDIDARV